MSASTRYGVCSERDGLVMMQLYIGRLAHTGIATRSFMAALEWSVRVHGSAVLDRTSVKACRQSRVREVWLSDLGSKRRRAEELVEDWEGTWGELLSVVEKDSPPSEDRQRDLVHAGAAHPGVVPSGVASSGSVRTTTNTYQALTVASRSATPTVGTVHADTNCSGPEMAGGQHE